MKFSLLAKARFYLTLAYYKLISPLECKNLRLQVFLNECRFLFAMMGLRSLKSKDMHHITLKTKFGDFRIRNIETDLAIASPSFERLDMNNLTKRIYNSLTFGKKVIFVDIGASFGKFTITLGNQCKKYSKKLSILSFEPEPESYKLLNENVLLNRLRNVKTFNIALSDRTSTQKFYYYHPMKQIVSFKTPQPILIRTSILDKYTKYMKKDGNVDVYIKIDIEGNEMNALKGSKKTITRFRNITLLIEDSISITSHKLIQYLSSHGTFLTKKTAYNSFWKLTS